MPVNILPPFIVPANKQQSDEFPIDDQIHPIKINAHRKSKEEAVLWVPGDVIRI